MEWVVAGALLLIAGVLLVCLAWPTRIDRARRGAARVNKQVAAAYRRERHASPDRPVTVAELLERAEREARTRRHRRG